MTIVGWELNHCQPLARHIPKIIKFLDYVPEKLFPSNTTGEKIKRYRLLHGMTWKQFAKKLGMDEVTLVGLRQEQGNTLRTL